MSNIGSGAVAWDPKINPIVTLSFTGQKYVVASLVACQTVWMRRLIFEFLKEYARPTQIFYNHKSISVFSNNHVFHQKNNHILIQISILLGNWFIMEKFV